MSNPARGLGEEGRIRAALSLGSPEEHHRARVRARLRTSGHRAPIAERPDYPDVEQPMPPIPGGEGLDAALAALDTIVVRVEAGAQNFAVQGAHVIEALAKVNASEGAHSPSHHGHVGAPDVGGPNVVLGELRRSITVGPPIQAGFGGLEWSAEVGPAIVYGRAIEMGMFRPPDGYRTPGSKYYKRHPGFGGIYAFLRPARDEFLGIAEEMALEEMTKAVGG